MSEGGWDAGTRRRFKTVSIGVPSIDDSSSTSNSSSKSASGRIRSGDDNDFVRVNAEFKPRFIDIVEVTFSDEDFVLVSKPSFSWLLVFSFSTLLIFSVDLH